MKAKHLTLSIEIRKRNNETAQHCSLLHSPTKHGTLPSMKTYFYTDANGQKQGPVSKQGLRILAARGMIEPDTRMETCEGRECLAGQIPGLWDDERSPGFFFGWVATVILTLVLCAGVVIPAGFLAAPLLFLLFMWKLFTIESHLRSIREHYENSE